MEFLISDTFTDSLTRLTGDEQKATKTTAFDLQLGSRMPLGGAPLSADQIEQIRAWILRGALPDETRP